MKLLVHGKLSFVVLARLDTLTNVRVSACSAPPDKAETRTLVSVSLPGNLVYAVLEKMRKLLPLVLSWVLAGALMAPCAAGQEIGLNDFVNADSFIEKLRSPKDEVSKYLFDQFVKTTKDLIQQEQNFSYLLRKEDIRDSSISLLRQLRLKENAVSVYLFNSLTPETQRLIILEGGTYTPSEELQDAINRELNGLLQQDSLYEESHFKNVKLLDETKKLLHAKPTGRQLVKLNRWLLEDAYPREIKSSRVELPILRGILLEALKKDLNNLIKGGHSLYEESRFKGIELSDTTKTLLAQQPAGEQLVILNRRLLEDAYYPKEIAKWFEIAMPSTTPTPDPTPKSAPRPASSSTPPAQPPPSTEPQPAQPIANLDPRPFYAALQKLKVTLPEDCSDAVGQRILQEYGAVFVAQGVVPPSRCVFANEAEVQAFQRQAKTTRWQGFTLQTQALSYLGGAMREGAKMGLRISPRGGEAAGRSFGATVKYWNSRFYPALAHWTRRGAITPQEAARIRSLPLREQVAAVLQLEAKGYYFSKDLTKSILYSVAAPGSSQHIALLALDINEFKDSRVRALLAKYGWFQTVKSDLPHFTFLGVPETDLPRLGLRAEVVGGQKFWVPDMTPTAKQEDKTDKPPQPQE